MVVPYMDIDSAGVEGIEDCIRAGVCEKEISDRIVDSCCEFSKYRCRYESTAGYRKARETFLSRRLYALALGRMDR